MIPTTCLHIQRLDSDRRGQELGPGQILAVRCLVRALVMFRGEDGQVHAVDAYCPHLGADLGVGGTVARLPTGTREVKLENIMLAPDPVAPGGKRSQGLEWGLAKEACTGGLHRNWPASASRS